MRGRGNVCGWSTLISLQLFPYDSNGFLQGVFYVKIVWKTGRPIMIIIPIEPRSRA